MESKTVAANPLGDGQFCKNSINLLQLKIKNISHDLKRPIQVLFRGGKARHFLKMYSYGYTVHVHLPWPFLSGCGAR